MKTASLRLSLLLIWIGSLVVAVLLLIIAHLLQKGIGPDQISDAITSLICFWLPIMSCLAVFWFGESGGTQGIGNIVNRQKAIAAIVITSMTVAIILAVLAWYSIGVDYGVLFVAENPDLSFDANISRLLKIAGVLGALGSAPSMWLSGRAGKN